MSKNLCRLLVSTSLLLLPLNLYAKSLTRTFRVNDSLSDQEKIFSKVFITEFKKRAELEEDYFKSETLTEEIIQEKKVTNVESRGAQIIEAQKAKIRAQLAKKNGQTKGLSGKEKIKMMLEKNKQRIKERKEEESFENMDIATLAKKNEENLRNWGNEVDNNLKGWVKEYQENLQKWAKLKVEFEKNLPKVKENLDDLSASEIKPKKKTEILKIKKQIKRKVTTDIPKGAHFVNGALDVPIRDQHQRPTCSSFTGIRAVEILLSQNNIDVDLSEQYFYWASKPKCRKSPCSEKGSWVGRGYEYSSNQFMPDIPKEVDCEYKKYSKSGNQTQVPLSSNCSNGFAKVTKYEYVHDLDSVTQALKSNFPVIASVTLTENFYKNEGLILKSEIPSSFGSKDEHAGGHSVLLVGVMKMPRKLKGKEGSVCFITANSWGEGWGKGGYSCMSESWLRKHKRINPFVILKEVRT